MDLEEERHFPLGSGRWFKKGHHPPLEGWYERVLFPSEATGPSKLRVKENG